MAKHEKKLTKEQINEALRRPIRDGLEYSHLIDKPALDIVSESKGDTFFGVQMIKKWVLKYYKQVARLAPVLKGKDLETTAKNIHWFLLNHVQYQIDYVTQHIRSPANIWHNRQRGIECKNYTLFTSAILMNLGIKHYIRQVKQAFFEPTQYTHVYVVVPKNQITGSLSDGYFVIDATSKTNKESIIKQKNDVLMGGELPYLGLNGVVKKRVVKKKPVKRTVTKPKARPSTKKQFPFN